MSSLKDLRQIRITKLNKLLELGVNPYPAKAYKNVDHKSIIEQFDQFEGKSVICAGRILAIRTHGKLAFIDLKDATGKVQVYLKADNLTKPDRVNSELTFDELMLLDSGDFVECVGVVTKTQRGEISVEAAKLRLLTKAIRPMPSAWDGLKDKETRLRRRYLDTNLNQDVYDRFVRRAKFWEVHRKFFWSKGFLEMNIPVLESIPGGGDATPFITHMNAINQDFYLRISQELFLKRLIGGGYEKVFEIGPRFRNEGLSDEHLPEHIAMEFYWAYADWEDGMRLMKELYSTLLSEVYGGKTQFKIRGYDVDFTKEWELIDFGKIIQENFGISVYDATVEDLKKLYTAKNIKIDFMFNLPRAVDNLWKVLRKDIAGPAYLINHPKYLSPLQKPSVSNPKIVERVQLILAGSELGNGWSEVTDGQDQYARFKEQQALRDSGDTEAQWLDIDYVEMLEYGMPPTFGWGHSERLFWFLEDVSAKEGVPFPQLKHEVDELTREIYGATS